MEGFVCVTAICAEAARYTAVPALALRTTYDDNVFSEDVEDFEFRISPGLSLAAQTGKTRLEAIGVVDIIEFLKHSELDHVDQRYDLSATVTPTEVWQVGLSGSYADDHTYDSALEESGIIAEPTRRKVWSVEPFLSVALNDVNTVQSYYELTKVEYLDAIHPDSRVHGGGIHWLHDLKNGQTRISFLVSGNLAEYEQSLGDLKQQTYRVMPGFEHQFSETLKTSLLAGLGYMQSEYPQLELTPSMTLQVATREESDYVYLVDGSLRWQLERLTLSAGVNRDINSSVYGENIVQDRIQVGLGFRWSEDWTCNLSATYYRSETKGSGQEERSRTISVMPGLRYRIAEDFHFSLGYRYVSSENQITDRLTNQNRVWIQLSKAWPELFD
ncbi:MAG TPA: hypothetical protein EYP19_05230 [Desulfobacterales bacterium]|nr:hypothetical protein [Desulfobacterales bacterium]